MAQFFHHNDFGYAARCPRTMHLHVCFGNVALAATAAEFQEFRASICDVYSYYHLRPTDPDSRSIAVRTPAHKMALVFTMTELTQLWEILENTALLLEVEEILAPR
jgi:hypothetical protein